MTHLAYSLVTPSCAHTSPQALSVADPVFQLGLLYIAETPAVVDGAGVRDFTSVSKPPPVTWTIYSCSRLGSFCAGAFVEPGCLPSESISSVTAAPYDVALSNFEPLSEQRYRRCRVGLLHRIFGTTDTATRLQSPSGRIGYPRPTKRSPLPRGTNPGMHLNWIAYTRRIGRLNVVSGWRLRISNAAASSPGSCRRSR